MLKDIDVHRLSQEGLKLTPSTTEYIGSCHVQLHHDMHCKAVGMRDGVARIRLRKDSLG